MKKLTLLSGLLVLLAVGFLAIRCQHEDEAIIPIKGPDPIVRGTEIINCTNCTPLAANGASADFNANAVPPNVWYFDKGHSNVMWETPYKNFGSLLTGRFNYFVLKDLNFDEGVPANISFEGYVRLNTCNTGEPGRDAGCLLTTFGTSATNTTEAANIATLKSKAGTGRYSTTDEGFLCDADFTFLGITKPVTVKMYFSKKTDIGTAFMSGVHSEFEMNALADFLPGNTNIGEKVKVRINNLMRIKKP
jgi:polyisoprenoid-binding protein YceI